MKNNYPLLEKVLTSKREMKDIRNRIIDSNTLNEEEKSFFLHLSLEVEFAIEMQQNNKLFDEINSYVKDTIKSFEENKMPNEVMNVNNKELSQNIIDGYEGLLNKSITNKQ